MQVASHPVRQLCRLFATFGSPGSLFAAVDIYFTRAVAHYGNVVPIDRQQFVETAGGPGGKSGQDVCEPAVGINIVGAGGGEQGLNRGSVYTGGG
jgi:hypothetical protein